jgi:hypothetical protein
MESPLQEIPEGKGAASQEWLTENDLVTYNLVTVGQL